MGQCLEKTECESVKFFEKYQERQFNGNILVTGQCILKVTTRNVSFEIVELESVKVKLRKQCETGLNTDGHEKLFRKKPCQSRCKSIVIWLLFFICFPKPFYDLCFL